MPRSQVVILSTAHSTGDGRIRRWVQGFSNPSLAGGLGAGGNDAGTNSTDSMRVKVVALGPADALDGTGTDTRALTPAGRARRIWRAITLPIVHRGDVVVAIDPELYVPVLAVQRLTRGRAIADVHEDFAQLANDHDRWGPSLIRRVVAAGASLATTAASQCDATVVADHHLQPASARRRVVGRNVAEPADFDISLDRLDALHAVYAGDLTPQRGLDAMLEGVVLAPQWHLDLFGPERSWAQDAIASAAERSDGRIRYRGQVAHADLVAELPKYHVGLSLLHPIPSYTAAMPSKIYEYQAAGLATITSDLPRAAALVQGTDSGIVLDDDVESWPTQLADALARLAHDRDRLTKHQENAAAAARESGDQPDGLAAAVNSLVDLLDQA